MLILEPQNSSKHIQYYINTNKTILYIYNGKTVKILRIFGDKWSSMEIDVLVETDNGIEDKCLDFKTIINGKNNFIKQVLPIASTIKKPAFFNEIDEETGIIYNYFNEFLGSEYFLNAVKNNMFKSNDILDLLKKETPVFYYLIKNLFHNEDDKIILNFLNWLRVCSFEDVRQDVLFLFFGTSEQLQGQGAGKGVLISLLKKLLSGLVESVSNSDYESNFNSNLLNKKIVVFDEVNFKTLKYDHIKNLTGSNVIRIEFKGKEPISADNVSSWLMFTNEHDLHNKITFDDRRTFLIRPNPQNDSLKPYIQKQHKSFKNFEKALFDEQEKIVHILAKCRGKVLGPNELPTKAKIDYFKEKSTIEMVDLKEFYQFIANKKMFLKCLTVLTKNNLFNDNDKIKLLKSSTINYKLFFEIYQIFLKNGLVKKESPLMAWERLKEYSLKNGFDFIHIDMNKTAKYEKYRDKSIVIKSGKPTKELRTIKQKYREIFGKEIEKNNIVYLEDEEDFSDFLVEDELDLVAKMK